MASSGNENDCFFKSMKNSGEKVALLASRPHVFLSEETEAQIGERGSSAASQSQTVAGGQARPLLGTLLLLLDHDAHPGR